jgi:DNA-directed RNA polymerase subunit RPC12/RpoP
VELEIAGPGEFACPNCGVRNVVRGPAGGVGAGLGGVPDLGAQPAGSGLAGVPQPPPQDPGPPPGIDWIVCPGCSYRFAVGEVDRVSCPTCGADLDVESGAVRPADPG